ncbi:hypothetical protein FB446DRAFT_718590 [Lentinula raphanica]|nr:hypothetical protein FB446DRAFT_718590 [Lentinula raphanica]
MAGSTSSELASPSSVTYDSLVNLGLSRDLVTLDDFLRVYQHGGPLSDAISFFVEHVKGRQSVNDARSTLLYLTEQQSKQRSLVKLSQRPERPLMDVASSRLAKAKKDEKVFSNMLQAKLKANEETQAHLGILKHQLYTQRRVNLLLLALRKNEEERVRRFEEMSSLFTKMETAQSLGDSIHEQFKTQRLGADSKAQSASTIMGMRTPRNTQDTLTALNAYHVRLARLSAHSQQSAPNATSCTQPPPSNRPPAAKYAPPIFGHNPDTSASITAATGGIRHSTKTAALKNHLRTLIAQKLGVKEGGNDPELDRVFHEFLRITRARAQDQIQYKGVMNSQVHISNIPKSPLEIERDRLRVAVEMMSHNYQRCSVILHMSTNLQNQKIQALQDASDLSLDLVESAQQALKSLTNFRTVTLPVLQESIDSRTKSVRSTVDRLRAHIVTDGEEYVGQEAQRESPNAQACLSDQVREILRLSGTATSDKILEETERMIKKIHVKSQYLGALHLLTSATESASDAGLLVASYHSQKDQTEETTRALLNRKIEKADVLGSVLVRDIEVLLKEVETVAGHGRISRTVKATV